MLAAAVPDALAGTTTTACTYGSCAPSGAIINNIVTYNASSLTSGILSDRINQASSGGLGTIGSNSQPVFALGNGNNKAAGSLPPAWGLWGSFANTWVRDGQSGANFNGAIFDGMGGADYSFANGALAGLAAGYEHLGVHTGFNNGGLHSDGFAIAPYAAYRFTPNFFLTGQIGHTSIRYHEGHGGVSGSYEANRWFGAADVNAQTAVDQWRLRGAFGLFYVTETQLAYTQSDGSRVAKSTPYVGELRLKGSAGYEFPTSWGSVTPFASARLEGDPIQSRAAVINAQAQTVTQSRFGVTFGAGAVAAIGDRTTLTVGGTTTQFRRHLSAYGVGATLRVNF